MFDNPYAFIRWIVILSGIALIIYRFQFLQEIFRGFHRRKNKEDEIQNKVEELLSKKEDRK